MPRVWCVNPLRAAPLELSYTKSKRNHFWSRLLAKRGKEFIVFPEDTKLVVVDMPVGKAPETLIEVVSDWPIGEPPETLIEVVTDWSETAKRGSYDHYW